VLSFEWIIRYSIDPALEFLLRWSEYAQLRGKTCREFVLPAIGSLLAMAIINRSC
jgi:hypothetical protein